MKNPARYETVEDFRKEFSDRKLFAKIPEGKILTLADAVKIALLNNPTNLAAAQAVFAARYGYLRALSAYFPELNAHYSIGHTLSSGWDLKNPPVGVMKRNDHFVTAGTIQASFLLFDGFARELETIISNLEYQKSAAAEKNVQRLLKRAVAYAYYDMYLAGEEEKIFQQDLDFQNEALLQAEERFRNGNVSKASVLNFQILAAGAKSDISNAKYRRQMAYHALSALMGYYDPQLPENVELEKITIENSPQIHDEYFYLALAVKYRPDLQEEKITAETAWRSKQKAIADFLPEIRLFGGFDLNTYDASYGGYRYSGAHSKQGAFTYGIEGKWNLFKGFDSFNQFRKLEALEEIARWKVNARFLEVAAEIRDAHSNCRNAVFQIKVFQDMARWVKEQRDLVFSEYRNGRETITRLNEAQNILIEAQNRLIVSIIEFRKAMVQLAAATGIAL